MKQKIKQKVKNFLNSKRDFINSIIINRHGLLGRKYGKLLDLKTFYVMLKDKQNRDFIFNFTKDREYIIEYSFEKLKKIIYYAYNFVPFYREFYDKEGFHPDELKSVSDISKIPILKKNILKKQIKSGKIFSTEKKNWKIHCGYTTGSTADPIKVCHDANILKYKKLGLIRALLINGILPSDPLVLIWRNKGVDKREVISFLFGNFLYIPIIDIMNVKNTALDKEKIFQVLNMIEKFQPKVIRGYVSALYLLAKFYAKNKNKFSINPELIIGSAEYLPYSIWDTLEDVFNCKVLNLYGGTEASPIAISTRNSRDLMIFEDLYHIDLVDFNDKPVDSGVGKIIVTDLYNRYMPLIRYEMGDIAEWREGNFIFGFKTFKEVKGRKNDIFILPGGKFVFADVWYIYFRNLQWVKKFKVIQEDIDFIIIYLEVDKSYPFEKEFTLLKKRIEESFGKNIKFQWKLVDYLPLDKGEKFRYVISKVEYKI